MKDVEAFEVLEPGILTTVQDVGRCGYREFGVPPSGALDTFSFRIGNILLGNDAGEAGLEATVIGPKLKALREVAIAVTGGDLMPVLNGDPLEMWRVHLLIEGDVISFKGIRSGCRAYLAVNGGFSLPRIMESRSTYLSGRFGGLEGRPLRKGDVLRIPDRPPVLDRLGSRFPMDWILPFKGNPVLSIVPGPQDDHFTENGFRTFSTQVFQVSRHCDRMGIRLEGPTIERRSDVEESIISEGFLPGAIQVPGDGKPIIILTELVTGGYTKIATVISVDLPKVAQLKPGDRVRFHPISIEEAHQLLKEQEWRLEKFRGGKITRPA
ncbi:MAG: hypothetical protein A2170_04035 [Deltaproteobacteria bacterium RBG_13_53_10]|nr:MAG: hypothetical protein A2170_04035 [Deltaproteobacteria bacterium RBG_13_53_10]